MKTLPQPWSAAMEATMFTGWVYAHLKPHALTKSAIPHRVRYNLSAIRRCAFERHHSDSRPRIIGTIG